MLFVPILLVIIHSSLLFILPFYQSLLPHSTTCCHSTIWTLFHFVVYYHSATSCHFAFHYSFHSIAYNHSTICSLLPFVTYCHSTIHSSLHFVVCYHFANHSSLHNITYYHFAIQSSFCYVNCCHSTSRSSFHFAIPYSGFKFCLHTWTVTKSGHCIHLCTSFELSSKLSSNSITPLPQTFQ